MNERRQGAARLRRELERVAPRVAACNGRRVLDHMARYALGLSPTELCGRLPLLAVS